MRKIVITAFLLVPLFFAQTAFAFDHEYRGLEAILQKNLHYQGKQTLVNYRALRKSPDDLKAQLAEFSGVSLNEFDGFSREEQIAFLINAYNAFTLKLIIDNYPVVSIRNLGSLLRSPWKKKFFMLFGKESNLDAIENGMLRKNYREPRIHFALNCASLGCPSLRPHPFSAEKLDQQLNDAARDFINNPAKNRYEAKKKTLFLSKIFDWYEEDFEKSHGSVPAFIAGFIETDKAGRSVIGSGDADIEYLDYDWNLNEFTNH